MYSENNTLSIIFQIHEAHAFRKYSTCWGFLALCYFQWRWEIFFLTEWFWRNFLMESCGLVRTSQSFKCKSKKIPNNFWGPFPQWNWPTGRKAATCQPSFQWPLPLINMWYTYSWMVESDWIGPEVGNDNLGLFLPVMLRNVHFSKRLPNAMDPTLLRDISVMPNDLLKKLEWGFCM